MVHLWDRIPCSLLKLMWEKSFNDLKSQWFLIVCISAWLLNKKVTLKNNNNKNMTIIIWYMVLVYHLDVWFIFSENGMPVKNKESIKWKNMAIQFFIIWPLAISPSNSTYLQTMAERVNIIKKNKKANIMSIMTEKTKKWNEK